MDLKLLLVKHKAVFIALLIGYIVLFGLHCSPVLQSCFINCFIQFLNALSNFIPPFLLYCFVVYLTALFKCVHTSMALLYIVPIAVPSHSQL